jgi:hypothetical protein
MKQDITEYSDSELSLLVMNDEGLYRMRRSSNLRAELEQVFIFTDEQWDELAQDLQEEENE